MTNDAARLMTADGGPARLDVLNPVAQLEVELRGQDPLPARRERYSGADLLEAWDAFNRDYIERGIGDGFPAPDPGPQISDLDAHTASAR